MTSKEAFVAIVYVSTSTPALLEPLTQLAKSFVKERGTIFAHSFRDDEYRRTSFFLLDCNGVNLVKSASSLYASALGLMDFQQHEGSHPTLGVCDHITFCPLLPENKNVSEEELRKTGKIAIEFADTISPMASVFSVWSSYFLTSTSLADIRRRLGYFEQCKDDGHCVYDTNELGVKVRECTLTATSNDDRNSLGFYSKSLATLNPTVGVTCVGAIPYLLNFNVQFDMNSDLREVRKITKRVRELEGVEALTLKQGESYEVACNVKKPRQVGPKDILRVCLDQARVLSLRITKSYTTGPEEAELLRILLESK